MSKADRIKTLTRRQKVILTEAGLVAKNWYLLIETENTVKIQNKTTNKVKVLRKVRA